MDKEPPGIRDLHVALRTADVPVTSVEGQLVVTLPHDSPRMPQVHALLADRSDWRITTRPDGQVDIIVGVDREGTT